MKLDTYYKACDLQNRINDYKAAIDDMEGKSPRCHEPVNFRFHQTEDKEAINKLILDYLKKERAKLQKQFDNLK